MWELDYKESWAPKNWCFWTVALEKTLESSLDFKEIQPVRPKGDQSWVFIGRTDVEAETPVLWPPDAKSWLIGKDTDAGKDWGQEKGMTEDEMVRWHHWLSGHELGYTPEFVIDREAWRAVVHWVTTSRTWLSEWTELNWLCQSLWLCRPQQTVKKSSRREYRPPSCLMGNLHAGHKAIVRTRHRTDLFQIGKGVCQSCILSPWLFNLYAE